VAAGRLIYVVASWLRGLFWCEQTCLLAKKWAAICLQPRVERKKKAWEEFALEFVLKNITTLHSLIYKKRTRGFRGGTGRAKPFCGALLVFYAKPSL